MPAPSKPQHVEGRQSGAPCPSLAPAKACLSASLLPATLPINELIPSPGEITGSASKPHPAALGGLETGLYKSYILCVFASGFRVAAHHALGSHAAFPFTSVPTVLNHTPDEIRSWGSLHKLARRRSRPLSGERQRDRACPESRTRPLTFLLAEELHFASLRAGSSLPSSHPLPLAGRRELRVPNGLSEDRGTAGLLSPLLAHKTEVISKPRLHGPAPQKQNRLA